MNVLYKAGDRVLIASELDLDFFNFYPPKDRRKYLQIPATIQKSPNTTASAMTVLFDDGVSKIAFSYHLKYLENFQRKNHPRTTIFQEIKKS